MSEEATGNEKMDKRSSRSSKSTSSKASSGSGDAVASHTSSHGGAKPATSTQKTNSLPSDMDNFLSKINESFDNKLSDALVTFENRFQDMMSEYMPQEEVVPDDMAEMQMDAIVADKDGASEISDLEGLMATGLNTANMQSSSNEGTDEWQSLAKDFLDDETIGPKVNDGIAKMVNTMFSKRLNDDTVAQRMKNVTRPANCESMVTPKVNALIWDKLKPETRSLDIRMQKIQNCILKASYLTIEALNGMGTNPPEVTNKKLVSGLAFLSHSMSDLNLRRRDLIRPELNQVYKHLCSSQIPVTDELFGGDLHKAMKDISESHRVVGKITRGRGVAHTRGQPFRGARQPWRGHSYFRGRYQPYQQSSSFLGAGSQGSRGERPTPKRGKEKTT